MEFENVNKADLIITNTKPFSFSEKLCCLAKVQVQIVTCQALTSHTCRAQCESVVCIIIAA